MISILSFFLVFSTHAHAEAIQNAKFRHGVEVICKHRDIVLSAARAEQISPRHMIGCLLSEYTFLKDAIDTAVDVAALAGFYWDPSLGFTQVKLSTARGIARELYNSQWVPDQQIIYDLLTPRTSTQYMARLIHNIVGDYKNAGFDIAGSVGLVCSSYLVGNSRARAMAHQRNGTLPELNYYGRFAHANESTAAEIESGRACR